MAPAFKIMIFFSLILQLSAEALAFSEHPHSQARWIASHQSLDKNRPTYLALHIKLEPEWHSYWENSGDSGAAPIFDLNAPPGVLISPPLYPAPQRIEIPPLMTFGYEHEVMYLFEARLAPSYNTKGPIEIGLDAEWLVCKVECIPAFGSFKLSLNDSSPHTLSEHGPAILAVQKQLPSKDGDASLKIGAQLDAKGIVLSFESPTTIEQLDFFPAIDSGISHARSEVLPISGGRIKVRLNPEDNAAAAPERLRGLLVYQSEQQRHALTIDTDVAPQDALTPEFNWIKMLVFAFLGGVLLNLMPCVFPVISIKLFSILQHAHGSLRLVRMHCLAYTLGVITSFVAIALLLIILRQGGATIGWGFQLQSLPFLISLSFLFTLLAFNFLGLYELNIPLGTRTARLLGKEGAAGQFFTGMLSTLVASPCTAPFMGVAIGTAFSQAIGVIISVFIALGFGLSAPYLIFMISPGLLKILPKPGAWMESLRQFMAFPLLATCLWLLWIIGQIAGTDALMITLASLLIIGLALWIKWRLQQKALAFIILLLAFGANLKFAQQAVPSEVLALEVNQAQTAGIKWESFSPQRLQQGLSEGRAVFIDFTADWCITCKVNERLTFRSPEVAAFIDRHQLLMLKADWTRRDPAITEMLSSYQRIGVPLYLFWAPKASAAHVLPEVLTPAIFMDELGRSLQP